MRKNSRAIFMLALCGSLLGGTSTVCAESIVRTVEPRITSESGTSESNTSTDSSSTKNEESDKSSASTSSTEKIDFITKFKKVDDSTKYIGTTKDMVKSGEAVALFNSKYKYLVLVKDGDKYSSMTEKGEVVYTSEKDIKNAEFFGVSTDYGFTTGVLDSGENFTVLVKEGNTIKYVGSYKNTSELNKLDDYLNYSQDAKVKLTLKNKTSKSVKIHVDYELDERFVENDSYGSKLRSVSLYNGDSHMMTYKSGVDNNMFDFEVTSNGTYKVVVNTYGGSGEATIKVTGIKETTPEEESALAKDNKAPNITFSKFPSSVTDGKETTITMYSDEPAVLYFNGQSSNDLVTEMKVKVSYNGKYVYSATDEAKNTKDGNLSINFFNSSEDNDSPIITAENMDTYWDDINKANGTNTSTGSDEDELPQTGGIGLVTSVLGGVSVFGAGVFLAIKESSKRSKVKNGVVNQVPDSDSSDVENQD